MVLDINKDLLKIFLFFSIINHAKKRGMYDNNLINNGLKDKSRKKQFPIKIQKCNIKFAKIQKCSKL